MPSDEFRAFARERLRNRAQAPSEEFRAFARARLRGEPAPVAEPKSGSFAGNLARSMATGAGAALGSIVSGAGYLGRKLDGVVPVEPEKLGLREDLDSRSLGARLSDDLLDVGEKIQDMARGWSEDVPRSLPNQVAEGVGSMIPYLAAGGGVGAAAGRALGATGRTAALAAGLSRAELETQANAGQTFAELKRAGFDDETAMRAARRQEWPDRVVNAALEPFGALSNRSRPVRALAEAVQEGVLQEPAQNITSAAAQRSAEGAALDFVRALGSEAKNYPEHFREVGIPAAIAGGIVGAATSGVGRRKINATEAPNTPSDAEMLSPARLTSETRGQSSPAEASQPNGGKQVNLSSNSRAEYEASVDPGLKAFVDGVKDGSIGNGKSYQISDVSPRMADDVRRITGVDVSGGTNNIMSERVRHIDKRHGASGEADSSMANSNDIARAAYVLNNYDSVELSPEKNYKFKKQDGSPVDILLFKKGVNGTFVVVEAIPDGKGKRLQVLSMWLEKRKNKGTDSFAPPDTENLRPEPYVQNEGYSSSVPVDPSLPNGRLEVNNLSSNSRAGFEPEMPSGQGEFSGKVRDVRRIIEEVTGLPVRERQVNEPGTLGYIDHLHEVIRSKHPNDIATMLHEFGHAMDRRFGISERNGRAFEELNSFGREMGYPKEQWHSEGLAQFFQWRGVDPNQAYARFPEYSKAFDAFLASSPEARAAIEAVFGLSQRYYNASPEARLDAVISDGQGSRKSPRERVRQFLRDTRRQIFDRQAPFAEVTDTVAEKLNVDRRMVPDEFNLEAYARTMPGTRAVVDKLRERFVSNLDGLTPQEYESLRRYMTAGGALDYFANGMNPGAGLSEAELTGIRERTPEKIKQVAKNMRREYNRMMDETLVDAGVISGKMIKKWREKFPNYVPMLADNADGSVSLLTPKQAQNHGFVNLANPVKKRSGVKNERDVVMRQDPVQAMLENYKRYGDVAARNRVGNILVNISELPGMARVAEAVPNAGQNTFYVWVDGKKKFFATDPELYAAFRSLDDLGVPQNKLLKFSHAISETFKAGTTRYNPWFILRNLVRDSFTVSVQSRGKASSPGNLPIINTFDGIMKMVGADEKLLAEAREDGLFYSSLVEMNRQNIPRLVNKHLRGGRFKESMKSLERVADRIGAWNEIVELAPKLREYVLLREQGTPRKQAAMEAREVNTDFQRSGYFVRALNQYVPFLNAQMQGVDKALRTFRERPVESLVKTGLYIMLPSLLEWAAYHDDEDYNSLDKEIKDTHWVFRLPGAAKDDWVRVPMPFELGVLFGGGTKRALDAMFERDPAAAYKFGTSLNEAFLISPIDALPLALKIPIELWANASGFMDRPIVPMREQNLPNRLQYGTSTSYVAKQAGKLGLSPRKVDHVIRSLGGTVGAQAVHMADVLDRGKAPSPARNRHESTLFRPYTVNSERSNHYVSRFYSVAEDLSRGRAGAKLEKKPYEMAAMARMMQGREQALSKIWREQAKIRESQGMTPQEKKERIDKLSKRAAAIAKSSLEIYDRRAGNKR